MIRPFSHVALHRLLSLFSPFPRVLLKSSLSALETTFLAKTWPGAVVSKELMLKIAKGDLLQLVASLFLVMGGFIHIMEAVFWYD